MPTFIQSILRQLAIALALAAGAAQAAESPSRQYAPGFTARPAASRLLVIPADMELFSISAGGVTEPRADWTEAAQKHFKAALAARPELGANRLEISEAQLDEHAEVLALHRAVAESIWVHHADPYQHLERQPAEGPVAPALEGALLPTKGGRLDWSLGPAVKPLRDKTGADYAVFFWVRDTYASTERKLTMLAMAALGSIMTGGTQAAYASLVDLQTGRVVWFNTLDRMAGDLREPALAAETVETLLKGFPALK